MQGDSYHGNVTNKLKRKQFLKPAGSPQDQLQLLHPRFLEWVAHDYTDLWISRLYILKLEHDHTMQLD